MAWVTFSSALMSVSDRTDVAEHTFLPSCPRYISVRLCLHIRFFLAHYAITFHPLSLLLPRH